MDEEQLPQQEDPPWMDYIGLALAGLGGIGVVILVVRIVAGLLGYW